MSIFVVDPALQAMQAFLQWLAELLSSIGLNWLTEMLEGIFWLM